jgi:peptidoglycan/LPS O-acetylase OafA/YrhL
VFLNRASTKPWAAFPLNVFLACGAALLSYFLVEKPMIALGKRGKITLAARREAAVLSMAAARSVPPADDK